MANDFPAEVKTFISANIKSVADLEVVLLLRENRNRCWTAKAVGERLATNRDMAALQLNKMRDRLLLVSTNEAVEECYQFQPVPHLEAVVEELATLYRERPVRVIAEIYTEPVDNVRTFADSFRLRKDK